MLIEMKGAGRQIVRYSVVTGGAVKIQKMVKVQRHYYTSFSFIVYSYLQDLQKARIP